jgi:GAF domain
VSLDDQVRQSLDRALAGARGQLESNLRAFAQELLRAAADERARAVAQATESAAAEVRHKAQAQVVEIREAAQRHTDEVRRSSEKQIADLRRALTEANAKAAAEIEDARRIAQTQVDDVQRAMDERVADLQQRLADIGHRLTEAERERDEARRSAVDMRDQANGLLLNMRMLDSARSLGEVLDLVAEAAAEKASRVAVLLARGDQLVGWRSIGFAVPSPRALTVDVERAGFLASVVRTGSAESRSSADTSEGVELPAFARDAGAGSDSALALPLIVGGDVVAVLYVDRPAGDGAGSSDRWSATLDALAHYASKVLEALTVQQAVGLSLPRAVARASHDAVAGLSHDRSLQ